MRLDCARLFLLSLLFVIAFPSPSLGQEQGGQAPAEAPPAGEEGEGQAPDEAPSLPEPVKEQPAPTTPPEERGETRLSPEEVQRLKAQLRLELAEELKQQLQAEMEAAARDAASQRAAAREWEEERWVEEVEPRLNFIEFDGYFRTRADLFYRLDLGTFDPLVAPVGRGTSGFPPPTLYRPFSQQTCEEQNIPAQFCAEEGEEDHTITSLSMRLRLAPTLNISEDIRVNSTIDVFDNLVYGSTPEARPGFANNPSLPLPVFSANQLPPERGFNALFDAVRVKRLWAEIMTPFGQLRIGRQPLDFGLGLLANSGNDIDDDYGDNVDQILFATRIAGHYVVPAYSISAAGPVGRGGGAGVGGDQGLTFFPGELGPRYNLDPRDDVHTLILSVLKRDKEEDIGARLRAGEWVLNYGVFGVYRTQAYDLPAFYASLDPSTPASADDYVRRNANAGAGSIWARFQWDKLRMEAEAVGIAGRIDNTATTSNGLDAFDPDLVIVEDGELVNQPLWVLQGGFAFESAYRFLNDSLEVGLDFGVASGDPAPGFGLRPVINQNPRLGDFDGRQYGACLERAAGPDGVRGTDDDVCVAVDNAVNNFKFDPDYQVDLILFREILGTVTDAAYIKPHVAYFVTESLGIRGDLIYSNALFEASTPGLQSPLGVEGDLTAFYRSDDGFFLQLQGGIFFPLGGLSHARDPEDPTQGRLIAGQRVHPNFLNAQWAYTLQALAGVMF